MDLPGAEENYPALKKYVTEKNYPILKLSCGLGDGLRTVMYKAFEEMLQKGPAERGDAGSGAPQEVDPGHLRSLRMQRLILKSGQEH